MQPHQDIETDADDYQPNHRTKSSILYKIGVYMYMCKNICRYIGRYIGRYIYRYTFIYVAYHINYSSPLQSITCDVLKWYGNWETSGNHKIMI